MEKNQWPKKNLDSSGNYIIYTKFSIVTPKLQYVVSHIFRIIFFTLLFKLLCFILSIMTYYAFGIGNDYEHNADYIIFGLFINFIVMSLFFRKDGKFFQLLFGLSLMTPIMFMSFYYYIRGIDIWNTAQIGWGWPVSIIMPTIIISLMRVKIRHPLSGAVISIYNITFLYVIVIMVNLFPVP